MNSDPFCGGCGAPCGVACDPDCGAAMDGKGQGAVLLLAVHIPGAEVDDDADIYAHELVEMVNEIRRDIGGGFTDVTLSGYPAVRWITESPEHGPPQTIPDTPTPTDTGPLDDDEMQTATAMQMQTETWRNATTGPPAPDTGEKA